MQIDFIFLLSHDLSCYAIDASEIAPNCFIAGLRMSNLSFCQKIKFIHKSN